MYRVNRSAAKELKSSAQDSSVYSPSSQNPLICDSRANVVSSAIHFHDPDASWPITTTRLSVALERLLSGLVLRGPWTSGGPGWDTWTGSPPAVTRPVASRWVRLRQAPPPRRAHRVVVLFLLRCSVHLLIPSSHQTSPPRLPRPTY